MSEDCDIAPFQEPPGSQPKETEKQKEVELEEEAEWSERKGKDCVVCQNAPVNRVLLPCRHACVCDGCVTRFQHCPICRSFVLESFALLQRPLLEEELEEEVDEVENE